MRRRLLVTVFVVVFSSVTAAITNAHAQFAPQVVSAPLDKTQKLPPDVELAIRNAKKQTVFPVSGVTSVSDSVLKTDKLIFQPDSTLVFTGPSIRNGAVIVLIAGEVIIQDPNIPSRIMRDMGFTAKSGDSGPPGGIGQPNYQGNAVRRTSANGGTGGNGSNGAPGETLKPPIVYILIGKMTHPQLPSRFVIDFSGVQGGEGGRGGNGGRGGAGDLGWTAHCTWYGSCDSGPGRGGDGGPGGVGGRGADGVPGGPGFDLGRIHI